MRRSSGRGACVTQFSQCCLAEEREMAGSGDNLQSGEDNNSDPDLPLFGVVVGGVGGVVFLSVTVTVLSVACIYCCKRRHRQLIVATSADRSGSGVTNGDDVRLLTMRQRELTFPASTLPGSAPPTLPTLPLENLNMAFVTLNITPRELAALYEREDTGCVVDRSLSCTPDLPPRTDDMLQIVTSDCCFTDAQWTLSTESTIPLSQLPLSPSQLNTPPFEHNSSPPSTSSCFLSSSQPTSSLTGLQASSPPLYPHSSSTPHLHSVSHPPSSPQSHISPSHSQPSTSPPLQKSQVSHTSLPHHTSHTQLSSSHQQLSTSPKLPSRSTSPLPPPIPPKPETRFQSTSDSDHDTATGSSYCILMKGPPQLPLVTLPENTSSNKQERILLSLLGQPLNQETTQSPGVTQTWDSPSFLEDSLNQNTRANGEELSPPPRPPKPTPSSPKTAAHSNTGKPAPPTPPLAGGSTSSSGRKTRAPPIPWDPTPSPPSLLPPRPGQREGGRRSEGSMSLPPRHIRRYPLSSSSGSTPGPGSGSPDQGDREEEVFLKYNESYHTITKFFHSDRLHTQ